MTEARPRKQVNIYTDGACSGNPGPGGWGCILEFGPHRKEMSGYMAGTTNNRMELFCRHPVRWGREGAVRCEAVFGQRISGQRLQRALD